MIDSDPHILEACTKVFWGSRIVFSLFHIHKRIKKLFKESEYFQNALDMVTTDLFLKEYLDLTQSQNKEEEKKLLNINLTFDQANYLNFLY